MSIKKAIVTYLTEDDFNLRNSYGAKLVPSTYTIKSQEVLRRSEIIIVKHRTGRQTVLKSRW